MSTGGDIFESSLNLEETHQEEGFQHGVKCVSSLCRCSGPPSPFLTSLDRPGK